MELECAWMNELEEGPCRSWWTMLWRKRSWRWHWEWVEEALQV